MKRAWSWGVLGSMLIGLLLNGCATLTYEAEEWRIAVPAEGDAQAVVRYIGLATPSTDPGTREKLAARIEELAKEKEPGSAFAPLRTVSSRKVYVEGNRIVLEEAGTLRNPFYWINQSGLNPATWWSPAPELVRKEEFIVKRDIEDTQRVIATDGRVVDEDTYTTILKSRLPVEISTDTQWQRQEDRRIEDEVPPKQAELILWPRNARTFYWKLSGPAFGKPGQLLTREYMARVKPVAVVPAPPPEEPVGEAAPEPSVRATPLPEEPVAQPKVEQPTAPEVLPAPAVPTVPAVTAQPPAAVDSGLVPVGGVVPIDEDATIK